MIGIIPIFDMYLSSLSMSAHFLTTAKARTLSLRDIYAGGEEEAYATFCKLRWPRTNGAPVCPRCGSLDVYKIASRRKFKCKQCSVVAGYGHALPHLARIRY
jgi:hypothetical protein